jgi:hypothetical protein
MVMVISEYEVTPRQCSIAERIRSRGSGAPPAVAANSVQGRLANSQARTRIRTRDKGFVEAIVTGIIFIESVY